MQWLVIVHTNAALYICLVFYLPKGIKCSDRILLKGLIQNFLAKFLIHNSHLAVSLCQIFGFLILMFSNKKPSFAIISPNVDEKTHTIFSFIDLQRQIGLSKMLKSVSQTLKEKKLWNDTRRRCCALPIHGMVLTVTLHCYISEQSVVKLNTLQAIRSHKQF